MGKNPLGIYFLKGETNMQTIILITISILGLIEIRNYIKIKDLEKRTERTFIEVERSIRKCK